MLQTIELGGAVGVVERVRPALRHAVELRDDFTGGLVASAHIEQVTHFSPQFAAAFRAGLDMRIAPSFPAEPTAHTKAEERKGLPVVIHQAGLFPR